MGKRRTAVGAEVGPAGTALSAIRDVLQSDADLSHLSQEETALLTSQLTNLVARVERVRALDPAYAGVDVSPDIRELLVRLEAGSSLVTGIH